MDRALSVAALLDPTRQVVPFHGRESELRSLALWRDSPVPQASLLLHGPAGAGKTRLLQHFRDEHWADEEHGRLLVVDDADRLPWQDVFRQLQDTLRHGPARTRVLLAARTTGWWWSSTRQRIADFDHEVTAVELAPTLDGREESFTLACQHFAKHLDVTAPDEPPPNIAQETVLDLHVAALTVVHGDPCDVNRTQLLRQLLQRDDGPATGRLAEDHLAVATPATPDPDLLARAAQRWPALRPRLDELITGDPGVVHVMAPDSLRIAAEIGSCATVEAIARKIFRDERFATDALPSILTRRLAERAEDVLDRAEMYGMLSARTMVCGLRQESVEASQAEVACYRELVARDRENRPLLADALGDLGLRLINAHRNDEVLAVSEEAIDLWREIAEDDPETVPQLASALEQISYRYQALGRDEDAMTAISRATLLFQELAKNHPALFRADFARVAAAMARRFHVEGNRQHAADSMQLAIANWRVLAQEDPRFEPELARNLVAAGTMLTDLGRAEAASETLKEAVDLFRRLAVANPGTFGKELAEALTHRSKALLELADDVDAALTAREAVMLWRETGDLKGLAAALLNVAQVVGDVGAAEEAVRVYRDLVAQDLVWNQAGLVIALATLVRQQLLHGQDGEALTTADECLDLCRRLPSQLVEFFGANLAPPLQNTARALSDSDHHVRALGMSEFTVGVCEAIRSRTAPTVYLDALQRHVCRLRAAERKEEARDTAHTAVVLWHLAGVELDRHVDYADALTIYGKLCAETRFETGKALRLTHRAVDILREVGEPVKLQFALATAEELSSW
ncbi:ATP-binding protein [Lentzea sp. HUAS12]|uniref:ATP-binding protein n=1 Tax=Lentzea sp. HUAS12 TaxID=2951806 RepID=UPI0020A0DDE2|nr:ATP-binding protein [Lentzea sp. HUAS12]USX48693.1 ATP-binding protein [Lentzea sp. HUAS12]